MARKSRQNEQVAKANHYTPVSPDSIVPVIRAAIYARLSLYDMNNVCKDSIQNQISLVENYLQNHPEMHLTDRYVDNGWSGTDFERPAFVRLMKDIQSGRINCVVVKDLSRFGRNYLETGYYLENIFPMFGVRFIAITDGYDSKTSKPDDLAIILKNILNDFYSRDLSRRYSDSYDIRKQNGVFRHGTPYGYCYDPLKPKHFTFDDTVSHYVHLIFQWALEDVPIYTIAMRLRELGAPTQERVEYLRSGGKTRQEGSSEWSVASVRQILSNQVYAGDFICGKTCFRKCDPYNNRVIPKEEWVIIKDTHPPYVSRKDFEQINKRLEKSTEKRNTAIERNKKWHGNLPNFYKNIAYCAICKRKIGVVRDGRKKSQPYLMYACHHYGNSRQKAHAHVGIHKKLLDTIALAAIQTQCRLAEKYAEWIASPSGKRHLNDYLAALQTALDTLSQSNTALTHERANLFELHADAFIDDETMRMGMEKLHARTRTLAVQLEEQSTLIQLTQQAITKDNPWLALFSSLGYPDQINSELAQTCIERIDIDVNEQTTILCKFSEWEERITNIYKTLEEHEHGT